MVLVTRGRRFERQYDLATVLKSFDSTLVYAKIVMINSFQNKSAFYAGSSPKRRVKPPDYYHCISIFVDQPRDVMRMGYIPLHEHMIPLSRRSPHYSIPNFARIFVRRGCQG